MKTEHKKVDGKKAKCGGCGHLLERHNRNGTCNAHRAEQDDLRGHGSNCLCGVSAKSRIFAKAVGK